MPSNYGPIVTAWTVEQAVRDTLAAWIDTVLGEYERQSDGRWDLRQIRRPRSWFIQSEFHDIAEKHLPSIHVESASKDLTHENASEVGATFPMVVQGVVKAGGQVQHVSGPDTPREMVRELNAAFEWACTWILDNKGDLGGVAAATIVEGARYDLVPPERDKTLIGFEIPIIVAVDRVHARGGGPAQPDDPPSAPLPETSPSDPVHESTTVTVSATLD